MKISKSKRTIVLIVLVLIPMLLMITSFNLNAQAGPVIPEPDPENGWHWEVDVGTEIYFEAEFILTNSSTGEVASMWKDIWIYNITSIEDVTLDWLGIHEFSQVNATQCYYNVSDGEIEPYYSNSQELALFGYNSTDPITHRIRAGQMGMPFLVPINGSSGVEVDILAPIINETFYTPLGNMAFNAFSNYTFDIGLDRIYFWNETPGLHYYSDAYYYDNGTLKYGEAYLAAYMEDDPMYINATMTQVANPYITDEVTWGVNIGEKLYYDRYQGPAFNTSEDITNYVAQDIMVEIIAISDVMLEKSKNSFSDEDPVQMGFQAVFADIYMWNGTDYLLFDPDEPIGIANNLYPQYFESGPLMYSFLFPTSATMEDFLFQWNNDTLRVWDTPFDEIHYTENGMIESIVINVTTGEYYESVVDKSTGIIQSVHSVSGSWVTIYEVKSQSLVYWSVSPGNVLYFKNNEREFWDMKATVMGTVSLYANMSALISDSGMTLPSGQPENQFFSCIYVVMERYDSMTDTWMSDGDTLLAIANIYWPISPLQFSFGPPAIMPMGTSSSELSDLFDAYSSVFDIMTYSPGHVLLRNTTLDREMHMYFDEATGRINMMYGWIKQPMPGEDWGYLSIYPKFYEALPPGSNSFTMSTDFPTGVTVDVEVEVAIGTPGTAFIYNQFSMNPVNVSVPNGTVSTYFDLLFENHLLIVGNITMTIHLPTTIDLTNVIFFFYAFNMSGTEEWDSPPPDFYLNQVTYNFVQNTITIIMEPFDRGVISAMAFIDLEAEAPVEIPGYNIFFLSMMILIVSGLVIRKVRKK